MSTTLVPRTYMNSTTDGSARAKGETRPAGGAARARQGRKGWTDETLGSVHGDASEGVLSEVLRDLKDESSSREVNNLEGVENRREVLERRKAGKRQREGRKKRCKPR